MIANIRIRLTAISARIDPSGIPSAWRREPTPRLPRMTAPRYSRSMTETTPPTSRITIVDVALT
jgi:hypothetical protein